MMLKAASILLGLAGTGTVVAAFWPRRSFSASVPVASSPSAPLGQGETHRDRVAAIQTALNGLRNLARGWVRTVHPDDPWFEVSIDGDWGPRTDAAYFAAREALGRVGTGGWGLGWARYQLPPIPSGGQIDAQWAAQAANQIVYLTNQLQRDDALGQRFAQAALPRD